MKTQRWKRCAASLFLAAVCLVLAAPDQGDAVLVDNNSAVPFADGFGISGWYVDGIAHLYQQWCWYRVGPTGPEAPLADGGDLTLTYVYGTSNFLDLVYTENSNAFEIEITFLLAGGLPGSGSSDISETVTINNLTLEPLDMHFFQYSDFDLGGSVEDSSAEIDDPGDLRHAFQLGECVELEALVIAESTVDPSADYAEVAYFSTTLDKLNDGDADDLSNDLEPIGPGDLTWAFQWDVVIPAGGTWGFSAEKQIRVPEPATLALLGLGLGVLGMSRRRARQAAG